MSKRPGNQELIVLIPLRKILLPMLEKFTADGTIRKVLPPGPILDGWPVFMENLRQNSDVGYAATREWMLLNLCDGDEAVLLEHFRQAKCNPGKLNFQLQCIDGLVNEILAST